MLSLGLENSIKSQSKDTFEYYTMWTTTKRVEGRASQIRENLYPLAFQTEVLLFLNEGLWSVSEKFYLFFLKPGWRNKAKIIHTTKQNQIAPVPPPCWCLFTTRGLLLGGPRMSHKGRILSWTLVQPLIPSPQLWEDGREIEVLGSVYRAGQIHSHPHPFSN